MRADGFRELYEAAEEPKELWLLEEAGHRNAYFLDREAYCERVEPALRSIFRGPAVAVLLATGVVAEPLVAVSHPSPFCGRTKRG